MIPICYGRLNIHDTEPQNPHKLTHTKDLGTKEMIESTDPDSDLNECCEFINMSAFSLNNTKFTRIEAEGIGQWKSDDGLKIVFNTHYSVWHIVEAEKEEGMGIAFSSQTSNPDCPVDNDWNVKNEAQWDYVYKYLTCDHFNAEDSHATDLAWKVCAILRENMYTIEKKSIDRRVNNLCQRAVNLARRTIRARDCAEKLGARRTTVHMAMDTVRQWRDTLKHINTDRNESCPNLATVLNKAIDRFYKTVERVFSRQDWVTL